MKKALLVAAVSAVIIGTGLSIGYAITGSVPTFSGAITEYLPK